MQPDYTDKSQRGKEMKEAGLEDLMEKKEQEAPNPNSEPSPTPQPEEPMEPSIPEEQEENPSKEPEKPEEKKEEKPPENKKKGSEEELVEMIWDFTDKLPSKTVLTLANLAITSSVIKKKISLDKILAFLGPMDSLIFLASGILLKADDVKKKGKDREKETTDPPEAPGGNQTIDKDFEIIAGFLTAILNGPGGHFSRFPLFCPSGKRGNINRKAEIPRVEKADGIISKPPAQGDETKEKDTGRSEPAIAGGNPGRPS